MKEPNNQALRTALEPCPFCKMQPRRNAHGTGRGVVCLGDGKTVGMIHCFRTYGVDQDEADAAWNRFAQESTTDRHAEGRLAGLEEAGWAIVPVEITQAMLDATCATAEDDAAMRAAWLELLRSAPKPPPAIRAIAKAGQ